GSARNIVRTEPPIRDPIPVPTRAKYDVRTKGCRVVLRTKRDHSALVAFEDLLPDDLHRRIERHFIARHREQSQISRSEPTDLRAELGEGFVLYSQLGADFAQLVKRLVRAGFVDLARDFQ